MRVIHLTVLVVFIFAGCTNKYSPSEYLNELQNNPELHREYSNGNHTIKCSYLPTAFLALKDAQKNNENSNTEQVFNEAFKNYRNSAYFTLTLSSNTEQNVLMENIKTKEEYFSRVNFLTSGMSDSFFIIKDSGDTVKSNLYDYQRSFGNSPDAIILLAFPRSETVENNEKDLKFYYKDKFLGFSQVVRLVFENKALEEDNIKITF